MGELEVDLGEGDARLARLEGELRLEREPYEETSGAQLAAPVTGRSGKC